MMFRAGMHGATFDEPASLCFVCHDGKLLMLERSGGYSLPRAADLAAADVAAREPFSFGHLGHARCFVVAQPLPDDLPPGWRTVGLRELAGLVDESSFAAIGRALQYAEWDRNHRRCGRCGERTERDRSSWSRVCTVCGFAAFPRVSPAVIMLVHRGDALLLAHAAHHPPGMYSVLAGFVEPGETLEECVAREVREEVGIDVADIRYFGSQPWPFPHSLMVGFTAAWAGGEIEVDGTEIAEAAWYTRDTLPDRIPSSISIARRLIDHFLATREAAKGGY